MTEQNENETPIVEEAKVQAKTLMETAKEHQTEILVGLLVVQTMKNWSLKRENAKLVRQLREAAKFTKDAADIIDNLSVFDTFFGKQR